MKHLTTLISALLFLVIGVSHVWALTACPSSGYFHNCYGTYTHPDGGKYIGEWKDNNRNGQGTFTFASGSKWVGAWENNNLNGYAITYYADGSINQEGVFKDDVLVEEK